MPEKEKICHCKTFAAAQKDGTDCEGYGSLILLKMGWQIGCGLPFISFCPWCGNRVPEKTDP